MCVFCCTFVPLFMHTSHIKYCMCLGNDVVLANFFFVLSIPAFFLCSFLFILFALPPCGVQSGDKAGAGAGAGVAKSGSSSPKPEVRALEKLFVPPHVRQPPPFPSKYSLFHQKNSSKISLYL